jgi:hypothetical protein
MQVSVARLASAGLTWLDFKVYLKFLFPSAPEKRAGRPVSKSEKRSGTSIGRTWPG